MRRQYLIRSVARLVPAGEEVVRVAFMWNRHRLMPMFTIAAFAVLTAVATAAGFETWTVRVAIGLAGAAVAGTATSRYWVLAETSKGLVWLRGSRVRQRAIEILRRLPTGTPIVRVGGSFLAHEWRIGDATYSVMRSYDVELQHIADGRGHEPIE